MMNTRVAFVLLVGAVLAVAALTGCPKAGGPDTGAVAPETSSTSAPAPAPDSPTPTDITATAPANIGNGKDAEGNYVCPVMGTKLTKFDETLSAEHNGKVYYFCCGGCPEKFKADPEKYIAQIEGGEAPAAAGDAGQPAASGEHAGDSH